MNAGSSVAPYLASVQLRSLQTVHISAVGFALALKVFLPVGLLSHQGLKHVKSAGVET